MFSGIVEETGVLKNIRRGAGAVTRLTVSVARTAAGLRPGDSVANNGCCLTVTDLNGSDLHFDLLEETLRATNLGALRVGALVNIERSLRVGDRIGGHFVTGHVDCTAVITKWGQVGADYELEMAAPDGLEKYLVPKGCVAIDGISLTVGAVSGNRFNVWIIPHTLAVTALRDRKVGDRLNIEFDMLAKYTEKLILSGKNS
ncbi:MAG: riboflavin synthase [Verrucomicrobiales bacterium]|jgi:riboflavin synthase|nr:riboflavin synthase [Verrucomicrobiales bacterium]